MFLSDSSSYCATLYDGLKSCPQDRHVHVLCDTDYIAHFIGRAEPELAQEGMQYLYPVVANDRAFQRHHYFLCGSGHLLFAFHLTWFYTRNEGD